MFSHVFVGADDVAASKKFYDAALGAIGVPEGKIDPKGRVFYRTPTGLFGLSKPIDGKSATHANGGTGTAMKHPKRQGFRQQNKTNEEITHQGSHGRNIVARGAGGESQHQLRDRHHQRQRRHHRPPPASNPCRRHLPAPPQVRPPASKYRAAQLPTLRASASP